MGVERLACDQHRSEDQIAALPQRTEEAYRIRQNVDEAGDHANDEERLQKTIYPAEMRRAPSLASVQQGACHAWISLSVAMT